jgi:hypothetical protein
MSRHSSGRKGLGVAAAVAVFVLVLSAVGGPARAGGGHRHDGGGFFSFEYSSPAYGYYEPYPYAPAYAYPPVYEPPYGSYDDGPMYYDDDSYEYSSPDRSSSDSYCREFQTSIVIDGRAERAFGTACLQPDGSWAVVN